MSTNENIEKERVRKIFAVLTTLYNSTRTGWTKIAVSTIILDANLKSPWVTDLSTAMVKHGLIEKQSIYGNVCKWRWHDEDNIPSIELAQKMHSACKLIQLNRNQNKEAVKKTAGLVKLDEYTSNIPTREQIKTVLTKLYTFYCDSPVFINTTILNNNKIPNPEFFLATLETLGFIKWNGTGYKWISKAEYDPYLESMIFDEYVAKYNKITIKKDNIQHIKKDNIQHRILNFLYKLAETNNGGFPGTLMPMIKKYDLNQHHLTALIKLGVIINLSKHKARPLYKTNGVLNLSIANDVIKYIKEVANTDVNTTVPTIIKNVPEIKAIKTEINVHPKAEQLLHTLRELSINNFFGSVTKYFKGQKLSKDYVTTAVNLGYIAYGNKHNPVKILLTPDLKIADKIIKETTARLVKMEIARRTKSPAKRKDLILQKSVDTRRDVRMLKVLKIIHGGTHSLPKILHSNNLHNMLSSIGQKLGYIVKSGKPRDAFYTLTSEPTLEMAQSILEAFRKFNINKVLPTKVVTTTYNISKVLPTKVVNTTTSQTVDLNAMKERAIARKQHLEAELAKVDKILSALDAVSKIGAELMNDVA